MNKERMGCGNAMATLKEQKKLKRFWYTTVNKLKDAE